MRDVHISLFRAAVAGTVITWIVDVVLHAVFGCGDRNERAAEEHVRR